jgi:protocatechuate 3,4-dioxygenase, alpha subunit
MNLLPTPSQTAGPYFHLGLTAKHSVRDIAGPKAKGERLRILFRLLDGNKQPVPDAMIEIWQANAEGKYKHPDDTQNKSEDAEFFGFGRLETDQAGACVFETIKPGCVPANDEAAVQAPHLNVSVFGRGILNRLATRLYFAGEPANEFDPILALVPNERRYTLFAQPVPEGEDDWVLDLHLSGKDETVFFDV